MGCEPLPRNTRVRVRITGMDLLTLDLHASLLARLDDMSSQGAAAVDDSADDDDAQAAAPLALAFDLGDAETPPSQDAAALAEPEPT